MESQLSDLIADDIISYFKRYYGAVYNAKRDCIRMHPPFSVGSLADEIARAVTEKIEIMVIDDTHERYLMKLARKKIKNRNLTLDTV